MPATDTSKHVRALQEKILQAMSGEQRLFLAFEMSDLARDFASSGIRQQHPDWNETQVARELLRLVLLPSDLPPNPR